jgi:mannosyltransferase OCH1-like enzyme
MQPWFRPVGYSLLFFLIIITVYITWPWLHAGYVWRQSTIKSLDFPSILSLNNTTIPRIIHQTYRDSHSIPFQWQQASNSCRILHPNYQYIFWSDAEGRSLIKKEFPSLLSVFDSYLYDIQRADVIRLVALYIHGGIYLDFDIICLKSLDKLLNYQFILPQTKPVGLSNDFIISTPKHPFLLKVLNDLSKSNQTYFTK